MSPARQPMSSGDIGGGGVLGWTLPALGRRTPEGMGSGTTISERQLAFPPPLTEGGGGLLPGARRQGAGAGCLDL